MASFADKVVALRTFLGRAAIDADAAGGVHHEREDGHRRRRAAARPGPGARHHDWRCRHHNSCGVLLKEA
eukprot:7040432-Prymnesium_polylepis.1